MFQTQFVEKVGTNFMFDIFFFEDHAICEIIWKILEPDSPRMAMWLMRVACWIPKNTKALSEYIIFIALLLQQWLHERLIITLYVHSLSCIIFPLRSRIRLTM